MWKHKGCVPPSQATVEVRYGTKVASQTPTFRLSTARRIRDIHKSSVLSDEMGAGLLHA